MCITKVDLFVILVYNDGMIILGIIIFAFLAVISDWNGFFVEK